MRMLTRSWTWVLVGVAVVLVAWSISGFVRAFELLGPPVHSVAHGWLGPTPRGSSCVADLGKVNDWRCEDISVFRAHRTGCRLWLLVFGYV
jgi:hypothetical protein